MMNEDIAIFPKQIKIDDYQDASQGNLLRVMETSNMLLGSGGKTSTTALIMVKCLDFMQQQGVIQLKGTKILQLGCGIGLVGIYLACIGANVILTDLSLIKDITTKNINLNKHLFKGSAQFQTLNWKHIKDENEIPKQQMKNKEEQIQFVIPSKVLQGVDYAIVSQCGGIEDLQAQLKLLPKKGLFLGFLERNFEMIEEYLNAHYLQKYLLEKQYEYEKIDTYHPDYVDERVQIYRIWK